MDQVTTDVTLSLNPKHIEAIDGYEAHGGYVSAALDAFSTAYEGIGAIHKARKAAEKNPTLNEAARILVVAEYASKQQDTIARKFDSALANLTKAIKETESLLFEPLKQSAASGTISGEIRAYVKALSSEKRQDFLSKARENGDFQSLAAVLGAPSYLSGMSEQEKIYHTRRYHEHNNPGVAKRLDVMKAARKLVEERGALFHTEIPKAMGAEWDKVNKLKKAKNEAEQAFKLLA